jgi:hypothetical protein
MHASPGTLNSNASSVLREFESSVWNMGLLLATTFSMGLLLPFKAEENSRVAAAAPPPPPHRLLMA